MSTVRPNIQYGVRRCPNKSALKVVREMTQLWHLSKEQREIFYYSSRDRTIAVTSALEVDEDYIEIVYVVHVKVSYRIIDFTQEIERGERAEKSVDSIILFENVENRRLASQNAAKLM